MRKAGPVRAFNYHGVLAIYLYELIRFKRTIWQSLVTPVITTSLYFVVFGAAIGARMSEVSGVPYGAFIVPGLMLLAVVTESLTTSAFSIYMPRFVGTIYEILSAPLSALEVVLAYVGATACKAMILAIIILATSTLFVPLQIIHPLWTAAFLVLTAATFSLFGFIIGLLAKNFEHLSFVPALVITPMTFLGGAFYSIDILPPVWRTVSLFNPMVYLISGFRWSFYGISDVSVGVSLTMTLVFLLFGLAVVAWIFRTGYRLKA
jgi:ABC-2 type transport system permease protein